MVKIQIVSDTHLEFRGDAFQGLIKPSAPILILAGDICAVGNSSDFETYKKFITYLSTKFKYIFHVSGNHEYYTTGVKDVTPAQTVPGINLQLKKFAYTFDNVFYLNNDVIRLTIDHYNYVFIGSALWTYVKKDDRKMIQGCMNDYTQIYMPNEEYKKELGNSRVRKYNIDDMSKFHIKAVNFVKREIKKLKPNDIPILITHHKPVYDKTKSDHLTQAYQTNLVDVIIKPPIKVAIHGHTHIKYDKIINKVRIVSNPKGYIGQRTKYNNTFYIEV
jgi:predicted phosphodiesterase